MKLTDFVAEFLAREGIRYVFGVTGGAVVHLFDSISKNSNIKPVFTHHEQAAALAAQSYARITNNLGAAIITTGPGGTNAITGVCAAWVDSVPCVYISGQARYEHTTNGKPIRQLGTQEFDIISLVKHITKYAVMLDDPNLIKYHLQKAVHLAKSGRPGPVWIDIPLNFQWASIEADKITSFEQPVIHNGARSNNSLGDSVEKCYELMCASNRPVVILGYGVRLAHATEELKQFVRRFKTPAVSSWNASDILPTDNELYIGRTGISGQRGANLAVQNSDLILSIGSHLSIQLTGTDYKAFAREAKKIVVDIDGMELEHQTVCVDLPIQCDAKVFLQKILSFADAENKININAWLDKCAKYKTYNSIPVEWREQKEYVNPYVFTDVLSDELEGKDVIVVDGGGTALYMSFQGLKVKEGQRMIVSSGMAAMGTGLPDSIGACFGRDRKRTICMSGDGSMQFNIHELQTISHHKLPIKIFVFNNAGYLAIRHTQSEFLENSYIGSSVEGGMSLPDFRKIADAYNLKWIRIENNSELKEKIKWSLNEAGPILCEIMISHDQELIPRMGFAKNHDGTHSPKPLEDMCPYLDREEFLANMVVKPLEVSLK